MQNNPILKPSNLIFKVMYSQAMIIKGKQFKEYMPNIDENVLLPEVFILNIMCGIFFPISFSIYIKC